MVALSVDLAKVNAVVVRVRVFSCSMRSLARGQWHINLKGDWLIGAVLGIA